MFDHSAIFDALSNLDVTACKEALIGANLTDPAIANAFLIDLKQSGCLLLKFVNHPRENKRDQFVAWLRNEFLNSDASIKKALEEHIYDAETIERSFRRISRSMETSEIWQLDPTTQAWGILRRGIAEAQHLDGEVNRTIKSWKDDDLFDPAQVKLDAGNGVKIDPGNASEAIAESISTTLFLLAYRNGWFDRNTDELILPSEVPIDETTVFRSGTHTLLSLQWLSLERAWDRARFFDAHVRTEEIDIPSESKTPIRADALFSAKPDELEIFDHISKKRVERIVYEQTMSAYKRGAKRFPAIKDNEIVALAPTDYISLSENIATTTLQEIYCVPVDDPTQLFGGLSLNAWIRGYAFFERLAHQEAERPILECLDFTLAQLTDGLMKVGLSLDQAQKFIRLSTLDRNALDLYDTPLIRVADGTFRFFAPAFQSPQIAGIVLSRIGSLNRRRPPNEKAGKPVRFEDKGHSFEQRVVKVFVDAGIQVRSFSYKIDGIKYDCDAAIILDETLFIFECKNYNIPLGSISELSHFEGSLRDFRRQASRIAQQFKDHPEIVRQHFGPSAKWTRVVPCVLQALPWSMGKSGDVYFYDQSALVRFIEDGRVQVHNLATDPSQQITSRHSVKLRANKLPTADELLKELEEPIQLRLHKAGWQLASVAQPIDDNMYLVVPEWRQKILSVEEQLEALGFGTDQISKIVEEMKSEKPSMLTKALNSAKQTAPQKRQGRNDICNCGSGIKHKKCCGKLP